MNLYAISHLNLSSDVERVAREHLDYLRSRLESLSVVDEVFFDDCDKRKTDFLILYKKLTRKCELKWVLGSKFIEGALSGIAGTADRENLI